MNDLTERELLVLMLLADGCSSKEIEVEIDRKHYTVKHIVATIREKLEAKNSTHAVAIAYHKGILKPRASI